METEIIILENENENDQCEKLPEIEIKPRETLIVQEESIVKVNPSLRCEWEDYMNEGFDAMSVNNGIVQRREVTCNDEENLQQNQSVNYELSLENGQDFSFKNSEKKEKDEKEEELKLEGQDAEVINRKHSESEIIQAKANLNNLFEIEDKDKNTLEVDFDDKTKMIQIKEDNIDDEIVKKYRTNEDKSKSFDEVFFEENGNHQRENYEENVIDHITPSIEIDNLNNSVEHCENNRKNESEENVVDPITPSIDIDNINNSAGNSENNQKVENEENWEENVVDHITPSIEIDNLNNSADNYQNNQNEENYNTQIENDNEEINDTNSQIKNNEKLNMNLKTKEQEIKHLNEKLISQKYQNKIILDENKKLLEIINIFKILQNLENSKFKEFPELQNIENEIQNNEKEISKKNKIQPSPAQLNSNTRNKGNLVNFNELNSVNPIESNQGSYNISYTSSLNNALSHREMINVNINNPEIEKYNSLNQSNFSSIDNHNIQDTPTKIKKEKENKIKAFINTNKKLKESSYGDKYKSKNVSNGSYYNSYLTNPDESKTKKTFINTNKATTNKSNTYFPKLNSLIKEESKLQTEENLTISNVKFEESNFSKFILSSNKDNKYTIKSKTMEKNQKFPSYESLVNQLEKYKETNDKFIHCLNSDHYFTKIDIERRKEDVHRLEEVLECLESLREQNSKQHLIPFYLIDKRKLYENIVKYMYEKKERNGINHKRSKSPKFR